MIDWDGDGRMWAVEMPGYMPDINAKGEHEPIGKIVVLEDTNQRRPDGQAHGVSGRPRPGALAEGARSRRARRGAAESLAVPGHQRRPARRSQRARHESVRAQGSATSSTTRTACLWALDNNIYTSEIDIDLRLKNGKFDVRKTLSRGQWGITQDDAGRIFRNTNESALHVDLVPAHYYMRHPNLLRTRGSYESLNGPNGELNDVWPIRPTRGVNRGYQYGILRADGTLAKYTSVCTPMIYRGDRLPAELYGNVFVVDPTVNLVSRIILGDSGNGLDRRQGVSRRARRVSRLDRRAVPPGESVARARRHALRRRHVPRHHPAQGIHDRVPARLRADAQARAAQLVRPHLSHRPREHQARHDAAADASRRPRSSCRSLSHPNGWRRDMAQQLLVERGDKSVVPALRKLASSAADVRARG